MHIGILESNLSGSGFKGVKIAKERRARITFFTRDLQRYLDVPGGKAYFDDYVDEIVYCETNEFDPAWAAVKAAGDELPFDAFLTMGEYDVVIAARIGRALGLPAPDPDAVAHARNKILMRERCAEHGVPMPAFRAVADAEEAAAAAEAVGLPCVVKPADETSSVDVVRCETVGQAVDHFRSIRAKQHNTRGQDRYSQVLVEECLHGYEVSVEILAEGGEYHVLGVTDKTVAGQGTFVEVGHVFPSLLPAADSAGCARVAVDALRAVGFDLGLAHVEVKVTGDGPKLIEINPRPAGGKIDTLVDTALDLSCLELMVRQYLGEKVLPGLETAPVRGAAIRYVTAPAGRVVSVDGADAARALPGITDTVLYVSPGDQVRPLRRNGDRLGHVMAVADDPYTASRRAESAVHEICVATEPRAAGRPVAGGIEEIIGNTPLVQLNIDGLDPATAARSRTASARKADASSAAGARVLAKLEMINPLSSSKDRAALYMLRAAEKRGQLVPGSGTIVEATSGNTGISLAGLAAANGYRCVIVLPDSATRERMSLLRALGAEIQLTPRDLGYPGAIAKAQEIHAATPGSWFPCQHENQDNVAAHYETTGPEIWADTGGAVDVVVCGVGTGGTLTGVARYLKERNPRIQIVAVEPEKSPVLSQGVGGLHRIPGLNGGFVAPTTDVGCIDQVMTVSDEDALAAARALARTSGLFVGVSSGAAAHACMILARKPEYDGKTIVTVLPDTGERYLSIWNED